METNEKLRQASPEETAPVTAAEPSADLRAGEKGFTIILFLVGLFAFWQSILLWNKMSEPRIASAAALPLFVSGLWTLLSFITILENVRKTTPLTGTKSLLKQAKLSLGYVFPPVFLIIFAAVIAYCVSMLIGVSFYIVTPIFLWGTMTYLARGGYLKNLLWTAICMAFVVLVFRLLFGVIMP